MMIFLAGYQLLNPPVPRLPVWTDQTCHESVGCRQWGLCKATDHGCVAATDDDCAQSEACTKLGRCKTVGGRATPTTGACPRRTGRRGGL
jgi:hypothetical protein